VTLAAFIVGLVGPLLTRILLSLGLSLVTVTGLTVAATALKSSITGYVNTLPLVVIQLGGLLGIWQSIGLMFGFVTFVITWRSTTGFIALAKS
jgi:hypothetical protein